jgi:hypothetical protein
MVEDFQQDLDSPGPAVRAASSPGQFRRQIQVKLDRLGRHIPDGPGSDQRVSNIALDYRGKRVTVSLKAARVEWKVTFDINKPSYALFTVKMGVAFTLEEGVVLSGVQDAGGSLVDVDGGTFIWL